MKQISRISDKLRLRNYSITKRVNLFCEIVQSKSKGIKMKQIQILTVLTFFCASANLVIAQTEKSGGDEKKVNSVSEPSESVKQVKTEQDTTKDEFKDFYVDSETGQIFMKPGPNRTKIDYSKLTPPIQNTIVAKPEDSHKKLTINGRIQFRGEAGSIQSPYSNGHSDFNALDWNFRRLRIGSRYDSDYWGMNIQLRMENMLNRVDTVTTTTNVVTGVTDTGGVITTTTTPVVRTVRMKDNRGYVHEAFGYVKHPYAGLRFTFGQINTQFTREYLQSSANFVTLERSIVTNAIPQFDLGVMFSANPLKELGKKWEHYLQLNFMVGNGKGAGGDNGTGRRQDLTTSNRWGTTLISPTYYFRAQYNIFGGLKNAEGKEVAWTEGEEIFQNDMKWSIGFGRVETKNFQPNTLGVPEYTPGNTQVINLLNGQQSNPDRGTTTSATVNNIAMTLPNYNVQNNVTTPGRPSFGLVGHTYDSTFTYKGGYLSGAYTRFTGSASNELRAWHTTIGYNVKFWDKYYIMPVLKYEEIAGDFHRDGNSHNPNDILKIYWAGINLYGDKNNFKAQLYYQVLGNKFDVNPNTGNYTAIDDRRIYLQLQGNFATGVSLH